MLVPLDPLKPRTLMMRMKMRMKRRTGAESEREKGGGGRDSEGGGRERERGRGREGEAPCVFNYRFMIKLLVFCLTGSAKRRVFVDGAWPGVVLVGVEAESRAWRASWL